MGVDGPRGGAAGGRRRLSALGAAWLRFLGLEPEPVDVVTPLAPDDVRASLSGAGLVARYAVERLRVRAPLATFEAVEAVVRLDRATGRTRVRGEVGLTWWWRVFAYVLPFVAAAWASEVVGRVVEAVRERRVWPALVALYFATMCAAAAWTVRRARTEKRRLRDRLAELVAPGR